MAAAQYEDWAAGGKLFDVFWPTIKFSKRLLFTAEIQLSHATSWSLASSSAVPP
jgi:hypothetical protein